MIGLSIHQPNTWIRLNLIDRSNSIRTLNGYLFLIQLPHMNILNEVNTQKTWNFDPVYLSTFHSPGCSEGVAAVHLSLLQSGLVSTCLIENSREQKPGSTRYFLAKSPFPAKNQLFGGVYMGAYFQTRSQWIADSIVWKNNHIGHLHLLNLLSHDTCFQMMKVQSVKRIK